VTVDLAATIGTVVIDDAEIVYSVSGIDHEDSDPVVLLPGLGGSAERDFPFLQPLLTRSHRVVAVDLDYGVHPAPSLDDLAGQLNGVLRELISGRRVILVGFSIGASVAATCGVDNPDVAALVLTGGVLRATIRHRLMASLRASLADPEALRSLDLVAAHGPAFLESRAPDRLAALQPFLPGERTAEQVELFASTDLVDRAPRITAPTLVIGCSDDDIGGVDQARALFAALPNARYAEIDSGHAVLVERPAEVLALVRDFVGQPLRHRPGSVLERALP
jgi:pimeloyl-ACP methyl ester carboxylesterase